MDKKVFSLFVDAENLPFWVNRPILRKRMRRLFNYIKKLETKLKAKDERIKEIEAGVLQVVADSNQAQIEAAQRIQEIEAERDSWRRVCEKLETEKRALKG